MANDKRATRKPRKKASNSPSRMRRGSPARKKGSQGGVGSLSGTLRRLAVSREVIGLVLLGAGLFFTAAFLTGQGALLGRVGLLAVNYLLGVAGVALAPLAVLAGGLILFGRLSWSRVAGAALLLVAVAISFAATLSPGRLFQPEAYTGAGGITGSALYSAIYSVGGFIGAGLVLVLLYAVGLSLLTGVGFRSAGSSVGSGAQSLYGWLRSRRSKLRNQGSGGSGKSLGRGLKSIRQPFKKEREEPEKPHPGGRVSDEREGGYQGEPQSFEVILPEKREIDGFPEIQERVTGDYSPPSPSLLTLGSGDPEHDAEGTSRRLTRALSELGVEAHVIRAVVGPRVTRYELSLGAGVKVGKVRNLQQDIAYALAATEVRILAPIPGKSAVGVEVPNTKAATVTLGDVFQDYPGANEWALPVGLGKDLSGRGVFLDLAEMPHLLVAGTTGSGKSVMLNSLLTSLILTTDPRQVKMVLIDPKRVELSQFVRIPHLITPVVTDVKKAANALSWAVAEMERRYEVLEKLGVRSLEGYNDRAETPLPYVVVVIDELADLMMTAAAKVEDAVIRLAQKARAVGIHLVVATQRPSVDVITGMIKANIPSRIAFAVSSQVDSRVILDGPGAEALLGMGDMLYKPVSAIRSARVQGAYISESEVDEVVEASAAGARARYIEEVTEPKESKEESGEQDDELVPDAASFVVSTRQASVSAVQRRFRVGYSRAGRIIDTLERRGVVGPYEGSKARSVVATELDLNNIFNKEDDAARATQDRNQNGTNGTGTDAVPDGSDVDDNDAPLFG